MKTCGFLLNLNENEWRTLSAIIQCKEGIPKCTAGLDRANRKNVINLVYNGIHAVNERLLLNAIFQLCHGKSKLRSMK